MTDNKPKNIEKADFSNKFRHFLYSSNDQWLPFPSWASYYLELGAALSNYESDNCRFTAAITLPARNFASSLIAAGIVISRLELSTKDIQYHIAKIEALPIGSLVTLRKNNVKLDGIYQGAVSSFGKQYFKIKYQKGGEIGISYQDSYKIEVSDKLHVSLPNIQSGRHMDPPSPLLKHFFDAELLNRFLAESRLECVILGHQKSFHQELCNFPIGYLGQNGITASGTIADLVRVKGSYFQASNSSYRSYILSSNSKYNSQSTSKLDNYVTIFDNPQGFIKWSSYFKSSNWFVLLDKTDRNFDLGIKEINTEYIQNRIEKQIKLNLPDPPPGIELMLFETRL